MVYPPAIREIAKHYHFKSIGGSSAGAIAAVITAAAEYRRRKGDGDAGFAVLETLPGEVGESVERSEPAPAPVSAPPELQAAFAVLVAALNREERFHEVGRDPFALLTNYRDRYFCLPLRSRSRVLGSTHRWRWLSSVILAATFVGLSVAWDVVVNVVKNDYGRCKGMTTAGQRNSALTPWLHDKIQRAGRGAAHVRRSVDAPDFRSGSSPAERQAIHRLADVHDRARSRVSVPAAARREAGTPVLTRARSLPITYRPTCSADRRSRKAVPTEPREPGE